MILSLLVVTLLTAVAVSFFVVFFSFDARILTILNRILTPDLVTRGIATYLAIYVVGVSGGVRIWDWRSTSRRARRRARHPAHAGTAGCSSSIAP